MKCFSPTTNIDVDQLGTIRPCCKFRSQYYPKKYNTQDNSFEEYLASDLLNEIKENFDAGIWPAGCERCRLDEEANIPSKRQLDYDRWHNDYNNANGILTASIAFGNICNLKCITCSSVASSKWRKEYKDIYGVDYKIVTISDQFIDEFYRIAPNIIHLDIPGGEPFYSQVDKQKNLLVKYVETGQSKKMSLHYTTNGQIFPDSDLLKLWKSFREIDLQLSIDGIGKRYEYIRFPGSWDVLLENINRYKGINLDNFRLSISHTVSAYNIYYLDEFYNWCLAMLLPEPYLGRVNNPTHMAPEVWSSEAKEFIVAHLQESKHTKVNDCKNFLINISSDQFNYFCEKMQEHDQYRGLDFNETFPEMAQFVRG